MKSPTIINSSQSKNKVNFLDLCKEMTKKVENKNFFIYIYINEVLCLGRI